MVQPKKVFLSEFAVNICSGRWLLTSASQLMTGGTMGPKETEVSNNSHIYLISKSPIISYSKEYFRYENGKISGRINYRVDGELREKDFSIDFPLLDGAVEVRLSKYPHREILTLDADGNEIRYLPASIICMGMGWHLTNRELSDLEVLYVGQAYGDGTRTAFERLKSHSTLQKILAQAQYESPDSEIQILTFEYEPYRIIHQMDGRAGNVISDYRDMDRFRNIVDNHLSEYEQICLVEAGLIRYFQPRYNAIYKDNFPSDKHKILESCYNLDFSGLIVEINTDELSFRLFSDGVKASDHHICKIDLLDPEKRWGFFHSGRGDGSFFKLPNVIERKKKC
ncbi:hypothetical protein CWB99_05860 [Pseudoalteromonas rubra]|uniref:Uncharacterized protein n=1 Tax=Pseudoalteromonas rubra TaxID=43658 RepID=A0A5S3WPR0_9GAMM|nr:hypothetical protein [Pseudoalteromonas rubra]TMP30001.1 hypothetical protein CWC00_17950 [Pseudoalteromonas rubra]TMP30581.1 hypothetical protein CWB99_05860 [Pseudoalteromonas rubra]